MLEHKKNRTWIYVLLIVAAAGALWMLSQEMPFTEETVEQPLVNNFAK
ncbi:MAG: hypothetical protein IJ689_04110 [Alphaproteobacteria bacterium]|nr:hypothetical protein [Alphaproteobacteria bacterium]